MKHDKEIYEAVDHVSKAVKTFLTVEDIYYQKECASVVYVDCITTNDYILPSIFGNSYCCVSVGDIKISVKVKHIITTYVE